jgi:large subunit ribosomal protein L6e
MGKQRAPRKVSRNAELIPGVNRLSRSAAHKAKAKYLHTKKGSKGKKVVAKAQPQPVQKLYPAENVMKPLHSRKTHVKLTHLRKSITPGTVLILLAGRFRGKRVVFLKQLPSGLLLINGACLSLM